MLGVVSVRQLLALLVIAGVAVTACGGAPSATSPSPASATAAPVVKAKVRAVYGNITPANLAPLVAADAGIFTKNGLDVDLQLIEGGAKAMTALLAGQTDIAHVGGTETMSAYVGGEDVVAIGIQVPVSPWWFMVPASYKGPDDLKGKTIGIVTKGGSSEVATLKALARLNLDPTRDRIAISAIGSVPNLATAMLSGAVYAGPAHPPETILLTEKGFKVAVDLAKERVPATDNGTVLKRSYANANREVVQRYMDSIVEAIAKARKDKPFTMEVLKKYKIVASDAEAGPTYDFYVLGIFPDYPYPRAALFEAAKEELVKTNPKVKDLDVTKVIDESFVKSAEDRKVGK